ncbi:helix-turn-helix domain-containing protein [Enterococcus gallinarum]|uniref:helix-turn-helix domain-containing protein n=1 Tax=Enterococcus gallinarum TaxID=1353 RepID=UPI001F57F8C4|nr:helix-turn-helix domain-containing protein [Enterococcus gallinarum]
MEEPSLTYPLLCRKCHLSPSSVNRRFTALSSSLAAYHLSLNRKHFPLLQGNEIQIRFFHYQLLRWMRPHLIKSSSEAFFCIKTIHEKKKSGLSAGKWDRISYSFSKKLCPCLLFAP